MPLVDKILKPEKLTAWYLAAISLRVRVQLLEAGIPVQETDVMQKLLDELVVQGVLGE